jgi:hypothetical protein
MKKLEILENQAVSVSASEVIDTNKKLAYSRPVFQVFGSVSKLTMGSAGLYGDARGSKRSSPN